MNRHALALLLGFALSLPLTGAAQQAPGAGPSPGAARALDKIAAIVRVDARAIDGANSIAALGERRSGTGVVIDERLVLTIGYLLLEVDAVAVTTTGGRTVPATVAAYDHASGLGLVRTALPLDGPRLELGDSDRVAEREQVLTVGQGETVATELMVVSRKPFVGSWEYLLERPIFTFPPVNNWSGAALIGRDGRLVGIGSLVVNDAAAGQPGVPGNLFVPVNLLKPILSELLANGRRSAPAQPWLGLSTEIVRGNLMVVRVSRGGPAEQAGVNPGDIVLAVGGQRFADQADFYRRLWSQGPAGTEVSLRLLKDGDVRDVTVRSVDRMETLARPAGV